MTDSAEPDVAGELIDALDREGKHVDDGVFTLDSVAAFRKLRAHQLADPHSYLLLLVEAGWLAAADLRDSVVRIETGETTTVEFGGLALERGALPQLFSAVLGGLGDRDGEPLRRARILQLVGLAANSALALEPKRIVIDASDEHGVGERVCIDPDGALTVETPTPRPPGSLRFAVEHAGFELGRGRAERQLLEQRCRYTQLQVHVDGELLSRGPLANLAESDVVCGNWTAVLLDGRAIGVAGHLAGINPASTTWIVNRGVAFADGSAGDAGVQVVVEVDLPMDLSRTHLLEQPELDAVRAAVRVARSTLKPPVRTPLIVSMIAEWNAAPEQNRAQTQIGTVLLAMLSLLGVIVLGVLIATR